MKPRGRSQNEGKGACIRNEGVKGEICKYVVRGKIEWGAVNQMNL